MAKQATQSTGPNKGRAAAGTLRPLTPNEGTNPYTSTLLGAIVAALPTTLTFLAWYGNCDTQDFVGSRAVKATARDAWEALQDLGDSYGLTVYELLEADNVDCGEWPDEPADTNLYRCNECGASVPVSAQSTVDESHAETCSLHEPNHSTAKEDRRNGAR